MELKQEVEIDSPSFTVTLKNGEPVTYTQGQEYQYRWAPTGGGGLIIYRTKIHRTFSAVIKDERMRMYAPGEWLLVECLLDED